MGRKTKPSEGEIKKQRVSFEMLAAGMASSSSSSSLVAVLNVALGEIHQQQLGDTKLFLPLIKQL